MQEPIWLLGKEKFDDCGLHSKPDISNITMGDLDALLYQVEWFILVFNDD